MLPHTSLTSTCTIVQHSPRQRCRIPPLLWCGWLSCTAMRSHLCGISEDEFPLDTGPSLGGTLFGAGIILSQRKLLRHGRHTERNPYALRCSSGVGVSVIVVQRREVANSPSVVLEVDDANDGSDGEAQRPHPAVSLRLDVHVAGERKTRAYVGILDDDLNAEERTRGENDRGLTFVERGSHPRYTFSSDGSARHGQPIRSPRLELFDEILCLVVWAKHKRESKSSNATKAKMSTLDVVSVIVREDYAVAHQEAKKKTEALTTHQSLRFSFARLSRPFLSCFNTVRPISTSPDHPPANVEKRQVFLVPRLGGKQVHRLRVALRSKK